MTPPERMHIAMACGAAAALVLSWGLTALAARISTRIGFVDRPGGHKSHHVPIPYGGGAAIALAITLPMAVLLAGAHMVSDGWLAERLGPLIRDLVGGVRLHASQALILTGGGLALSIMGLLDDWRPLRPVLKLTAILLVAAGVCWFGDLRLAAFLGTPASLTLSVLWICVMTNSLNFLDNMDGLSAGVAAICGAFFVVCGGMAGQILVPALGALFVGAVLGFLILNFPPARIFMGDCGSLLIGYWLAVISILTSYWDSGAGISPYALVMPLVVLAIPLYDFASVVLIRLLEGRNPLKGDQRHFSHRLVERGLSRRQAVLTIYLATATTGLCATLLPGASLRVTLTVLAAVLMVLLIVAILEMPRRKDAV